MSAPRLGQRVDSGLRVLVVGHIDRLSNRLDRNQYYRYEALARRPGVTLFGPGVKGYRPEMSVQVAVAVACGGVWPDLVLHGMDFKESGVPLLSGLHECPVMTALELQDSWAVPDRQTAFINAQRFDFGLLIVAHHVPFYEQHCPRTRFLWTPHAVNIRLFQDHGLHKDIDVLIYGNLAAHTYPLRARLAELLPRQPGLRVRVIPHPGYYPAGGAEAAGVVSGEALSRIINRSWITVSTSSVYQCVMMKYYEIAASRSLIAGDMPDEGRLIFGDDFLELRVEHSDAEILERLRHMLLNKERLMAMTDAAHHRVVQNYSTDAFAEQLLAVFDRAKIERAEFRMGTQAFVNGQAAACCPRPEGKRVASID